jgi:hypothetical protein
LILKPDVMIFLISSIRIIPDLREMWPQWPRNVWNDVCKCTVTNMAMVRDTCFLWRF